MPFEDLELRHLAALRSVAEEGSFIGAADALGYSQAAISQQIAALERCIGQTVFDRPGGPKPVTLTAAGRLLLAHATAIAERLDSARDELADLASGMAGRLRIGTYQSVSVQLLPTVVRELRTESPDLSITLVEWDYNDELADHLLAGEIDVCFLQGPYEDPRLDLVELGSDPYVVILGSDSPWAAQHRGRAFPTLELSDIPLVGQNPPSRGVDPIDAQLREHGVRPRYAFRSDDNGAMQGMVRAGMGPCVMGLLSVDTADPGIVVKRMDPPLDPRTIVIATPRGTTRPAAVDRFLRIAKKECRALLQQARR